MLSRQKGGIDMRDKRFRVYRKPASGRKDSKKSIDDIVRELRNSSRVTDKCAREFDYKDRHLLTVHHKDGNPRNNPPDGSNWENLCVYCHEDEHSRGLLGDYFSDEK
jgi:hypothetical protein